VVPDRGGVLVIDDPLALLSMSVWLFAAGMWPVAFLFGACSPCCQPGDPCPWLLEFDRCLRATLVDSDPLVGGDCRIDSTRLGTGGVEYMNSTFLQIHHVQSRIRITVRLSLSASGTSRTPVGETRTQVWRFNRAAPTSPAGTTYDVLGPPWHLQVDVSVTGVATQEEAGVVSSLETDEHGQPKLVLTVNQWTATITHDEVVTLFPVGLQRWGPGLGGTQSFRLTASSATATLTSGTSYSGWSVSKLTGLTTDERKLAVRLVGSLCVAAASPSLTAPFTQRIILDDVTAVDFLNGDNSLRINVLAGTSVTDGSYDLLVTPKNALCGISRVNHGIGIALGIYPTQIYAAPPEEYADLSLSISGRPYCNKGLLTLRSGLAFVSGLWSSRWSYRQVRFFGGTDALNANPELFFSGMSLLHNLEYGPYRTTAVAPGPGPIIPLSSGTFSQFVDYTYYLEGEDVDAFYNLLAIGVGYLGCPDGMEIPSPGVFTEAGNSNRFDICTSPTPIAISGSFSGVYRPFPDAEPRTASGALTGNFVRTGDALILNTDFDGLNFLVSTQGEAISDVNQSGQPITITPQAGATYVAFPPCELSGDLSLITLAGQSGQFNGAITDSFSVTLDIPSISFSTPLRASCGEWSPSSAIPVNGGTITRSCNGLDSSYETATIPARTDGLRFPFWYGFGVGSPNQALFFGPAPPLQLGACNLLGLRDATISPPAILPATQTLALVSGDCRQYLPLFGSPGSPAFPPSSSVPCDNCTVSVTQTAGEENGSVTLITSGDKAGIIEIVVARTWLGGQGVTFTVSCGDDTITQVVRRGDTRPEPITGLSVVRDPCSVATLTWEAPHDGGQPITEYRVEFRRIGASNWTLHSTTLSLTATITGLVRVGYEFRVFSVNSVNVSLSSNVVTNGFALGAPTSLTFTRDPCDEVQLSWVAPTQSECVVVANYRLEYRVGISGTFLVFGTVAGTQTTGTVTGLDPTLRYQFRVARIADDGPDLFSGTVTSGAIATTPFGVAAALGTDPGEVDVTWSANELLCFENTDYLVQFRPSTTSTWSDFTRAASADKFATVTGLTPATYFFRVRATNSIGNSGFSAQSNSVTIPEPE